MAVPQQLLALLALMALAERGPRRGLNPLARITDAAVGVLPINTVIEDMDIDALLDRVDVQGLVDRIDMNDVVSRIDMDGVVSRIDMNDVVSRIDMDGVVSRIDMDGVVSRIDMNDVVSRIDMDDVVSRIDMDQLLARIDLNKVIERIDINELLDRVDPDLLLDRVDADRLLDRVDPNRLLDRVDPNRLLERVDTNALIAWTDLNAAMEQVDVNRIMDRIDVEQVVDRAGVPDLVRESTGHMAGSMLDLARRQVAALDQIIMRITARIFRFPPDTPPGPPELLPRIKADAAVDEEGHGVITGHYSGPLARLLGFLMDTFLVMGSFTIFSTGVLYVLQDLLGRTDSTFSQDTAIGFLLFVSWAFWYRAGTLAIAGRTVGMGVVGLRVLDKHGGPLKFLQAVVRTLTMPLSFLLLGLGFVGLIVGRRRRALHDLIAGTVVVYDWGDRPAEMPAPLTRWLAEHRAD